MRISEAISKDSMVNNNNRGFLSVLGGPQVGLTIPLSSSPLVMGRGPDNDMNLDEATVSRRHAVIIVTPSGCVLRDLGSANGTFVSEEAIGNEDHPLRHGDTIHLAGSETTLIFWKKEEVTVKMAVKGPYEGPDGHLKESEPI